MYVCVCEQDSCKGEKYPVFPREDAVRSLTALVVPWFRDWAGSGRYQRVGSGRLSVPRFNRRSLGTSLISVDHEVRGNTRCGRVASVAPGQRRSAHAQKRSAVSHKTALAFVKSRVETCVFRKGSSQAASTTVAFLRLWALAHSTERIEFLRLCVAESVWVLHHCKSQETRVLVPTQIVTFSACHTLEAPCVPSLHNFKGRCVPGDRDATP